VGIVNQSLDVVKPREVGLLKEISKTLSLLQCKVSMSTGR
jgi:hypothetical protein